MATLEHAKRLHPQNRISELALRRFWLDVGFAVLLRTGRMKDPKFAGEHEVRIQIVDPQETFQYRGRDCTRLPFPAAALKRVLLGPGASTARSGNGGSELSRQTARCGDRRAPMGTCAYVALGVVDGGRDALRREKLIAQIDRTNRWRASARRGGVMYGTWYGTAALTHGHEAI